MFPRIFDSNRVNVASMKVTSWRQSFVVGMCIAFALAAIFSPSQVETTEFVSVELSIEGKSNPAWEVDVDEFRNRLASAYQLDFKTAKKFAGWILEASADDGIDPELVASIIATESAFDVQAVSSTGAIGPAQIQPNYWSDFCEDLNLEVPNQNISCGSRILCYLIANSESETEAIKRYNAGSARESAEQIAQATAYYEKIVHNRERLGYAL